MQAELFSSNALEFHHPTSFIIAGPSGSGKSEICFKLIRYRNQMFNSVKPLKVLYHLPARHHIEIPEDILNDVDFKLGSGIPDFETIDSSTLLVLDDLAGEINESVVEAFTRYSHHKSISIVLVTHNIFHSGKKNFFRTISLNTSIFFITRNGRDKRQIQVLATQICPTNARAVVNAYRDATNSPFGYLCVDCSQQCDDRLRLRTNVFPSDYPLQNIIYVVEN